MKRFSFLIIAMIAVGCGADEGSTDKGAEEAPLTDGKSDSFFRPSEHGQLAFGGVENSARMSKDATFHAWTFELSGDAEFTLKTEVSQNLDTVMYLYRREPGATSWGRFKRKNDDHKGEIFSQITFEGDAAEYRVIVKPFKTSLRGNFSVVGECDGAGCAPKNPADVCDATTASTPAFGYNAECADRISQVLGSQVKFSSSKFIEDSERCSLNPEERLAIDHYRDWFEGFVDFEESFDFDGDGIAWDINRSTYENGEVITVNAGGDEDGMSLIYDTERNLLAVYQHNQSPTADFFCGALGPNDNANTPDESCFGDILWDITPRSNATEVESGLATISDIEALDLDVLGLKEVAADFDLTFEDRFDPSDLVEFDIFTFESIDRETGALIHLQVQDVTATYRTSEGFRNPILVREAGPKDSAIICE